MTTIGGSPEKPRITARIENATPDAPSGSVCVRYAGSGRANLGLAVILSITAARGSCHTPKDHEKKHSALPGGMCMI